MTQVNYAATGSLADLNLAGARLSLARVMASAASLNCAFCSIKNAVIFCRLYQYEHDNPAYGGRVKSYHAFLHIPSISCPFYYCEKLDDLLLVFNDKVCQHTLPCRVRRTGKSLGVDMSNA
jgi:hypothetical protein